MKDQIRWITAGNTRVDENATQLAFKAGDDKRYESRRKRNAVGNNEEYQVGGIQDSAVYARE